MTDWTEALLRDMHDVPAGQQKSVGKPLPHCCRFALPPHTGACRAKMCDGCAVVNAAESRKRVDILERRGKTDVGAIRIAVREILDVADVSICKTGWSTGEPRDGIRMRGGYIKAYLRKCDMRRQCETDLQTKGTTNLGSNCGYIYMHN
jgi:hypothetical protein